MILWKKYKNLEEIIAKVGWDRSIEPLVEVATNKFLVRANFSYKGSKHDIRFAHIYASRAIYGNNKTYHLVVEGMSGTLDITHYSQINLPKK